MPRHCTLPLVAMAFLLTQACASYTTPPSGVSIPTLTDGDIAELLSVEPASPFPARVAVTRVQASGYSTQTANGYGQGRFSVLTARDVEEEADFESLAGLPQISGVAPLSRLLLPPNLETLKDLRVSAASLRTDLMLVYSIDTVFHVEGTPLGPLTAITLGFLPNKQAFVSSTTSGALVDVRTGFVYGVAEATAREEQRTTVWNTRDTIDEARRDAERNSFKQFVAEFENLWQSIVAQYASL